MTAITFESKVLPDGHLYCPKELSSREDARFEVTVFFDDPQNEASERDTELSAAADASNDFLSEQELSYYLSLKEA